MEPTLAIALPAMALGFGIETILTWVRTNSKVAEQEKRKLLKPETDKERILKELDEEIQRAASQKQNSLTPV